MVWNLSSFPQWLSCESVGYGDKTSGQRPDYKCGREAPLRLVFCERRRKADCPRLACGRQADRRSRPPRPPKGRLTEAQRRAKRHEGTAASPTSTVRLIIDFTNSEIGGAASGGGVGSRALAGNDQAKPDVRNAAPIGGWVTAVRPFDPMLWGKSSRLGGPP